MSGEQAQEMKAGRELDAWVAERVMGWERVPVESVFGGFMYERPGTVGRAWPSSVPLYSSSISAAWEIVEEMVSRGRVFIVKGDGLRDGRRWTVLCDNLPRTDADTAPLAICRAALEFVERLGRAQERR